MRHKDVPPFSMTQAIENEENWKLRFQFSSLIKARMAFDQSLPSRVAGLVRPVPTGSVTRHAHGRARPSYRLQSLFGTQRHALSRHGRAWSFRQHSRKASLLKPFLRSDLKAFSPEVSCAPRSAQPRLRCADRAFPSSGCGGSLRSSRRCPAVAQSAWWICLRPPGAELRVHGR